MSIQNKIELIKNSVQQIKQTLSDNGININGDITTWHTAIDESIINVYVSLVSTYAVSVTPPDSFEATISISFDHALTEDISLIIRSNAGDGDNSRTIDLSKGSTEYSTQIYLHSNNSFIVAIVPRYSMGEYYRLNNVYRVIYT